MPKYTLVAPPPKAKYTLVAPPPPASESPQAAAQPEAAPQPGFLNDLKVMGKEAIADVASGFMRLQGAIQSDPNNPIVKSSGEQADALNREANRMEAEAQAADTAAGREFAGTTVRGAGRSLLPMLASGPVLGPYGAISTAIGITGNQAITEAKDKGLTGPAAARYATTQAVAEGVPSAVFQKLGIGGIEKVFRSGPFRLGLREGAKALGLSSIQELGEEATTAIFQQASRYFEGVDPNALTPESIKRTARDVVAQTLTMGGVVGAPRMLPVSKVRSAASPPSSDTPASTPPPGDMNLTLTPQGEGFEVTNIGRLAEAQQAPAAPTAQARRQTPDTLPPLPPGAEIPVQGITAPTAPTENPRVAPITPGSAVLRPLPTLTPEQQVAWMAEADAMAPTEQEIVADYLMENPGNPDQLSPGEIVARSNRDIWRFTPEQQAEYEKAMGVTAQESEVIGNEEKRQEAPLLSAEAGAGVDVPAPAPSPASSQGSPVPQQQVATTTGLERLTWNELTSMSEEANRGRDASTLQSVLDEVRARKAIGNSGPRLAATPTPAPAPTPTLPAPEPATSTPIRFKRSGKGNAAVHEATFKLPKVRRSPDDPNDVAEGAYGTFGRVGKSELVPIESLSGGVRMSDKGESDRVQALAEKIASPDGYIDRLVVDKDGNVQEGQHRLEALRLLGAKQVPVTRIYDVSEGIPLDKMRAAVEAVGGLRREQVNQIVANVAEMDGEDYDFPRGYEKYYEAAAGVKKAAMTPPKPPERASKKPKKTGPPVSGKVGADGWMFDKTSGYSKDVSGYKVEVKLHKDASKDDRYEVVINGSSMGRFSSASDAKAYVESNTEAWAEQDLVDQRNAAEEERLAEAKAEAEASWQELTGGTGNVKQGPAPADTGIYRDLTAAAREGKRFVAELHERIAPHLTRIYQATSNPKEFITAAVAKIGEHILPYARKFISEVKRGVRNVNREFRQNPTRGSGPRNLDRAPLANPGTTQEARGFVDRVDEERFAPDEQTRAQWEAEADKLDKNEVLGKLKTGETFQSAAEVIAGKRVTDEAAWNAIYTGENIAESWSIADAWRKTGTQAARILGARYDPILSASEREQISKTNADIAAIDQQLDNPATPDAQFDALMQQRLDAVQSINDIKMTGTARRMLAEIFTSPRKSTDRKLKKIDKKLEDTTLSPKDRARLEAMRDAISKREGRALEEMRRRMLNSGIPLNNPAEMRKRDNILRALSEAKAHKSTFVDKAEELYKNMLFSASTAKNIISNTAFFTYEYGIVRPLEAAINSTIGIDSRAARVSNLGPMIAAAAPGIRRGVRNMIDSWRTEADMFELQTHGPNMNISGKLESRGAAIPGKKGRFIRSLGYRPLMATDSFNKSVIAEIEVANYANSMATEKGLTGRDRVRFIQRQTLDYDSPSWRHAVEVAERLTLTDESGPVVRKATEIRDSAWPLRFILPIIKTPAKELSRALQASPLGTARIAAKLYSDPTYTRKYLARDVAEQAAAWTIAIGLYTAFAPGDDDDTGLPVITGNQPYSKKRAAEFKNKAAITPPKSIRIGNRWYSYAALGAPSTALAATVDGLEAITDGTGDPLAALSEFMVKFMGNVKDQTFLSNLADIMDAFEEGGFPKWASNFAASWSPSVIKRAVKGMDSTEREMRAMGPMDKLSHQIMPTPYAPAKVDLFGRTVEKPASPFGPRGDLLWRIAGNTQVVDLGQRTPIENDMYRMFLNWNNQHKDERWAPALPATDYKFGEAKGKWSPQEYERLSIMSGQMALKLLTRINSTKPFNFDRPSKTDRERVDKVFEKAREQARKFMISTKIRAGLPKN